MRIANAKDLHKPATAISRWLYRTCLIIVIFVVFSNYKSFSQDISQGLVGYWPMECNSTDMSGSKLDGINIGNPICKSGKLDSALQFDGFTQYINFPKDSSHYFTAQNGFSWSLWFQGYKIPKSSTKTFAQTLIAVTDTTFGEDFYLGFGDFSNESKYLVFRVDGMGGIGGQNPLVPRYYPSAGFADSTWYHVVAICDYNSNKLKLYFNGNIVDSTDLPANFKKITRKMYPSFGLSDDGTLAGKMGFFRGLLDEIRVHNRALTDAEVKILANEKKNFLTSDKSEVDFGNILCSLNSKISITLKNTGDDIFYVSGSSAKNGTHFKVLNPGANNLSKDQDYKLDIQYFPKANGIHLDTLYIFNNNGALPLRVFLKGRKDLPMSISNDTINFNEIVLCRPDTTVKSTFFITNDVVQGDLLIENVKFSNSIFSSSMKNGDVLKYGEQRSFDIIISPKNIGIYFDSLEYDFTSCGVKKYIYLKANVTDVQVNYQSLVDFGNVPNYETKDSIIYFVNTGSRPIAIKSVKNPSNPFSIVYDSNKKSLNPGDSLEIKISLKIQPNDQSSTIDVIYQSPCGDKTATINLKAVGRYIALFDMQIKNMNAKIGDKEYLVLEIRNPKYLDSSKVDSIKFDVLYNSTMLVSAEKSKVVKVDETHAKMSFVLDIKGLKENKSFNLVEVYHTLGNKAIDTNFITSYSAIGGLSEPNILSSTNTHNICIEGGERLFLADQTLSLSQVYPNPVSANSKINFELIEDGLSKLLLYNSSGNLISTIFEADIKSGVYSAILPADLVESGSYFLQLQTPSQSRTIKLQVIK